MANPNGTVIQHGQHRVEVNLTDTAIQHDQSHAPQVGRSFLGKAKGGLSAFVPANMGVCAQSCLQLASSCSDY